MVITCPHCGFAKEIEPDRIPAGTVRATCPRCGESFPLPGAGDIQAPTWAEALPKAGFWIRFMARLIDGTIIALIVGVAVSVYSLLMGPVPEAPHWEGEFNAALSRWVFIFTIWLFIFVFRLAYDVTFVTYCGQTPGKMLLRVKVIRTDGLDMNFARAVFRELYARFLSKNFFLGYLMAAVHPQKQSAHDKIADTYVIKL